MTTSATPPTGTRPITVLTTQTLFVGLIRTPKPGRASSHLIRYGLSAGRLRLATLCLVKRTRPWLVSGAMTACDAFSSYKTGALEVKALMELRFDASRSPLITRAARLWIWGSPFEPGRRYHSFSLSPMASKGAAREAPGQPERCKPTADKRPESGVVGQFALRSPLPLAGMGRGWGLLGLERAAPDERERPCSFVPTGIEAQRPPPLPLPARGRGGGERARAPHLKRPTTEGGEGSCAAELRWSRTGELGRC
jgi:hypothetical protein